MSNVIGLLPKNFQQAEQVRNTWFVSSSVPLDTVLEPTYWRNTAHNLKPYDRIEVIHEEGDYWAELLVQSVNKHSALVATIASLETEEVVPDVEVEDLYVKYAGPNAKWRVLRKTPDGAGEVLSEGIKTKPLAIQKMIELNQEAA